MIGIPLSSSSDSISDILQSVVATCVPEKNVAGISMQPWLSTFRIIFTEGLINTAIPIHHWQSSYILIDVWHYTYYLKHVTWSIQFIIQSGIPYLSELCHN